MTPKLCGDFNAFQFEICKKETVYTVTVSRAKGGKADIISDGAHMEFLSPAFFPFDGGRHTVEMRIP